MATRLLHSDLAMLRLAHGHIVDTKLLYPHPKVACNCSATSKVVLYVMLGTVALVPAEALLVICALHSDQRPALRMAASLVPRRSTATSALFGLLMKARTCSFATLQSELLAMLLAFRVFVCAWNAMHALGMQGPPFRSALRVITEKFLKRQIQAGAHDSADDARAAMDLALLKMRCAFITMCMHPIARRSIASMSPLRMELQMREYISR